MSDIQEAVALLRRFNAWRCGDIEDETPDPRHVTKAIDTVCAALGSQDDAMDDQSERDESLGRAIQRACRDLPEGFTICIDLERGAGTVELQDEEGETLPSRDEGEPLSVHINWLVDEAIKSRAEDKDYE